MEGKTKFSRRLKQFDGLTRRTDRDPIVYERSTPLLIEDNWNNANVAKCYVVANCNTDHHNERDNTAQHCVNSDTSSQWEAVVYPDPQGGYNPPVFMRHPQPSEVQRGLSGGCLRGVFMWSWWKG